MTTTPYLILHRVRNQPAFDIAERQTCTICGGYPHNGYPENLDTHCGECSGLGYWWIASTWGFRCHPYRHWELSSLADIDDINQSGHHTKPYYQDDLPPDWPDLFPINSPSPHPDNAKAMALLINTLGLGSKPIKRRII